MRDFVSNLAGKLNDFLDYKHALGIKYDTCRVYLLELDGYNIEHGNRDTLTKEIEFQNLEIQLCEKKIKEAQVKVSERTQDRSRAQQAMEERKKDLESKRAELDEIMEETRAEEEQLREKADDIELRIEARLLQSFKRIRKNARNGLGVVYVQRDACGGCFNKIPPQRQLDIKMHKKIIVCEYCGRILVDPELAGVKLSAAGEDKPKKRRTIRKKSSETPEE